MLGFLVILTIYFPAFFFHAYLLEWGLNKCMDTHDKRKFQKYMKRFRLPRKPYTWEDFVKEKYCV